MGVTLIEHNNVQLFISRAVPVEPLARLAIFFVAGSSRGTFSPVDPLFVAAGVSSQRPL